MPREQDVAALLKRLLAKEVTDADDNEVLDEIIALRDRLPPADAVTVTETTDYLATLGTSQVGYCEVAVQLAEVDTQADWQSGDVAAVDVATIPGSVLLPADTWMRFRGEDVNPNPDYVEISGTGPLQDLTDVSYTFKATFTIDQIPSGADGSGTERGYVFCRPGYHSGIFVTNVGRVGCECWLVSGGVFHYRGITGPEIFSSGTKVTAAMTVDVGADLLRLYVDGTQVASVALGYPLYDYGANPFFIGLSGTISTSPYRWWLTGKVHEVSVWDRTLTVAELQEEVPLANGLRGWWDFSEQAGTTLYDKSGTGANGTVYRALWGKTHPAAATLTTKPIDLGATPLTRPVLLRPILASNSPAGTSAVVTRYRTRANQVDPWGEWTDVALVPSGGALTATAPQRYIEVDVRLATTDTAQAAILDRLAIYN